MVHTLNFIEKTRELIRNKTMAELNEEFEMVRSQVARGILDDIFQEIFAQELERRKQK